MSVTQQAIAVGRGLAAPRTWRQAWIGGVHGADYVWAVAFALPYIAIFLFFVVYRIYVKLEQVEQKLTKTIQELALREHLSDPSRQR